MEFGSKRPRPFWLDSKSVEFFDPEHSADDSRFIRIGHSAKSRILLIVFCERADASIIRIISARKATTREVRDYEKGI
ncbi:MAG TPA: BrnT family toxin [Acidobacteriota bacterium]